MPLKDAVFAAFDLWFQDANGSMGLTVKGLEKTPVELIQEEVVIKVASGSDHLACLTDKGELLTLGNVLELDFM